MMREKKRLHRIDFVQKKSWLHRRTAGVLALLFCLMTALLLPVTALASSYSEGQERVFDEAGLFSASEKEALEEQCASLKEDMSAEVLVLTVEDAAGADSAYVSDSFFFDNGFDQTTGGDGVLMLIDMDNRELYLGTYGDMIRVMTDDRIDDVVNAAYDHAADADYAGAAEAALSVVAQDFQAGIVSDQYNYDTETGATSVYVKRSITPLEALMALAISGVTAFLTCLGVVKKYKMKENYGSNFNMAYRADSAFQFQNPTDELVNTIVTHVPIPVPRPDQNNRGGMGGGFSGRSSTHSYGGHSAGGGGRKF